MRAWETRCRRANSCCVFEATMFPQAFSDYRKAVADELLARKQLDRAKDLYAHGAIPEANLESAQDGEDDAKVTLETAAEHLRLLGNDPNHPTGIVDIVAPVSGVITDQQVTNAGGCTGAFLSESVHDLGSVLCVGGL